MLPPLAFRPILKARAWGSTRLRSLGKPVSADTRIGESWELADLPDSIADGQSTIAGGRFDGVRLRDLRLAHRDELLGVTTPAPGFCTMIFDPVCGSDGTTWSNACMAGASGHLVVHDGPC